MGAFAYATGFRSFDKNGKTDILSKEFRDAFNWYTGLAAKGIGVMPADIGQGWGGGALAVEKVACCFEGAWIVGFLRDESPNLNYGATLLPKYPGTGQRGNLTFTVSWSMNAASKHKDEAFKVLELLTSPEAQQWVLERGLALPSRRALVNSKFQLYICCQGFLAEGREILQKSPWSTNPTSATGELGIVFESAKVWIA
ncbi:MAG: extracellular solute-binding protein [Bacillota bacterium]